MKKPICVYLYLSAVSLFAVDGTVINRTTGVVTPDLVRQRWREATST